MSRIAVALILALVLVPGCFEDPRRAGGCGSGEGEGEAEGQEVEKPEEPCGVCKPLVGQWCTPDGECRVTGSWTLCPTEPDVVGPDEAYCSYASGYVGDDLRDHHFADKARCVAESRCPQRHAEEGQWAEGSPRSWVADPYTVTIEPQP